MICVLRNSTLYVKYLNPYQISNVSNEIFKPAKNYRFWWCGFFSVTMCVSVTLPAITMDVTRHSIRYEIRYVIVKSLRIKRNDGRLSSIFYSVSFLNNTCCSLYLILQTHFRKWHVWELQSKRVDSSILLVSFSSTLNSFVLLPRRCIEYDYMINYDIFICIGHEQNNML